MEPIDQEQSPQEVRTRKITRSWFTKKLERKLMEKELGVPQQLLNILDVPFDEFSPEDKEIYETSLKPLTYVFVEHLIEVYEVMGQPRSGWEEMLERVEPSPIKVLATLVIHEEDNVEALEDDPFSLDEIPSQTNNVKEKFNVRSYSVKEKQKGRWWDKKFF
jgi:hypothetical protein